MKFMLKLRTKK